MPMKNEAPDYRVTRDNGPGWQVSEITVARVGSKDAGANRKECVSYHRLLSEAAESLLRRCERERLPPHPDAVAIRASLTGPPSPDNPTMTAWHIVQTKPHEFVVTSQTGTRFGGTASFWPTLGMAQTQILDNMVREQIGQDATAAEICTAIARAKAAL